MPGQILGFLYGIRIFGSQRQQRAVARQFIQIPDRSGEKAAPPIRITAIVDRAVRLKCHRVQTFSTRFDHINLIPYLCTGKIDILVDKTFSLCFRGIRAREQKGRKSKRNPIFHHVFSILLLLLYKYKSRKATAYWRSTISGRAARPRHSTGGDRLTEPSRQPA